MRVVAAAARIATWELDGRGAARGLRLRTAVLLEIRTATGAVGLGEAAPLPAAMHAPTAAGHGSDTLAGAMHALDAFIARVPLEIADGLDAIARIAAEAASPSARFAIETALLAALARERGLAIDSAPLAIAQLLGASHPLPPLAVVVDTVEEARAAHARGARCFKLKVPGVHDGEFVCVRAIAAATPGATLRLDANQAWPRELVTEWLAALADLPIEYVEEPCIGSAALLADALPVRIALDESLATLSSVEVDRALASPSLAALVLKPTLLGGFRACLELAARARAAGVAAIVTHALEGPIGTAACAELARALGGTEPVGLAPHPALAAWSISGVRTEASRPRRSSATQTLVEAPAGAGDLEDVAADGAKASRDARAPLGLGIDEPHLERERDSVGADANDPRRDAQPPSEPLARDLASLIDSLGDPFASHAALPAVITATGTLTFAQLYRRAERGPVVATGATRASVQAIVATPSIDTIAAVHAALAERRPIALLHHALPAAELARRRALVEAAELPVDPELARRRALVEAAELPVDAAVVLFTSGSTGDARGVVLGRAALLAAAHASAAHLGWRADDAWLVALSLAHAGGLAAVVRCLVARKPIVLLDRDFDREAVAALLERATLASLVPTQLAALLDDPAWRPPVRLRAVLLGGAAASPALLAAAAARGVPCLPTYGMTESFGQLATARAGSGELVPLPGVELVAGTRERPAPIRVRAPQLATCYLDGTAIAPELVTADLGFVDAGALHVVGRADDVILTGGENVHPATVEAVLAATPGVRAVCAFGVPDERWGQIVAAAVATDAGFDRAALAAWRTALAAWHAALPPHARPRELAIARELPQLPGGKVDRRAAARLPREPVRYDATGG